MIEKLIKVIIKILEKWIKRVGKSFVKNFPQSLISLILLPIFIAVMLEAVYSFSLFASAGYLVYCIRKLDKILEDIRRSIIWGVVYIIGAVIFDIFLTSVVPMMSKGDGTSIFSALVILFVLLSLFIKKEELRRQ